MRPLLCESHAQALKMRIPATCLSVHLLPWPCSGLAQQTDPGPVGHAPAGPALLFADSDPAQRPCDMSTPPVSGATSVCFGRFSADSRLGLFFFFFRTITVFYFLQKLSFNFVLAHWILALGRIRGGARLGPVDSRSCLLCHPDVRGSRFRGPASLVAGEAAASPPSAARAPAAGAWVPGPHVSRSARVPLPGPRPAAGATSPPFERAPRALPWAAETPALPGADAAAPAPGWSPRVGRSPRPARSPRTRPPDRVVPALTSPPCHPATNSPRRPPRPASPLAWCSVTLPRFGPGGGRRGQGLRRACGDQPCAQGGLRACAGGRAGHPEGDRPPPGAEGRSVCATGWASVAGRRRDA